MRGTALTRDRFGLELGKSRLINAPWSHIPRGAECELISASTGGWDQTRLPREAQGAECSPPGLALSLLSLFVPKSHHHQAQGDTKGSSQQPSVPIFPTEAPLESDFPRDFPSCLCPIPGAIPSSFSAVQSKVGRPGPGAHFSSQFAAPWQLDFALGCPGRTGLAAEHMPEQFHTPRMRKFKRISAPRSDSSPIFLLLPSPSSPTALLFMADFGK